MVFDMNKDMSVDLVVFKIYLTWGNEIIAQEPTNVREFKTRTFHFKRDVATWWAPFRLFFLVIHRNKSLYRHKLYSNKFFSWFLYKELTQILIFADQCTKEDLFIHWKIIFITKPFLHEKKNKQNITKANV